MRARYVVWHDYFLLLRLVWVIDDITLGLGAPDMEAWPLNAGKLHAPASVFLDRVLLEPLVFELAPIPISECQHITRERELIRYLFISGDLNLHPV